MACFLVPTVEAIALTVVTKAVKKKEDSAAVLPERGEASHKGQLPFTRKLKWLTNMLWGGSALLAFEHVWHGEVTPWFPFLTAASDPVEASVMLHEMATVGVAMAVLITAVWGVMLLAAHALEKKALQSQTFADRGEAI